MVRIPSLTRRSHPAPADDRTDERTPVTDDASSVRDQRDDRTDYRSRHAAREARRAEAERRAAEAERSGVVAAPRPHTSGLATIGLILGVVAAAAVATGVLAAAGVALGVLALLFGMAGVSATNRRHVAGRFEALFAVVLGLAAVVFGILSFTDTVSWLDADTNQVSQMRDWLYDRLPWLDDL